MSDIVRLPSFEGKESNGLKKNWSRIYAKDMRISDGKYMDGYTHIEWGNHKVCNKCWHKKCQCKNKGRR